MDRVHRRLLAIVFLESVVFSSHACFGAVIQCLLRNTLFHRITLVATAQLIAALWTLPSAAFGSNCIDYGDFIHWLGGVDTPGQAGGVAVAGTHAYIADGTSGLQVIDISDPASPSIVGSVLTPGNANGVAVAGTHAYLATSLGFQVIDISDPASPSFVDSVRVNEVGDVAVVGSFAYIANYCPFCGIAPPSEGVFTEGLAVIDISDPASPSMVGSVYTSQALGVAVAGTHAYVARGFAGLQVIDISDPASPSIVGSLNTPWAARGVAVNGTHAYVAAGTSGLQVIDISDPASPSIVGSVHTSEALGVAVAGIHAYVADGTSGLQVIDISDPGLPAIVGNVDTDRASGVAVAGTQTYVADLESGLQVIDILNPASPTIVGSVDPPGNFAYGVAVAGTHACVADGSSGLQVIDISNPALPAIVGSVQTGDALGVAVTASHAYVVTSFSGLKVIDISNPALPAIVGTGSASGVGVAVAGSHAYVVDESSLRVVDISDPASPEVVGSIDTPGNARGVAVAGIHACVAAGFSGLQVIDISDPASLTIVGSVPTPHHAIGVAIEGQHAYVADDSSGLQVIDISDPASASIVGSVNPPGQARSVAVTSTHAYMADASGGLQVIDISDPASPSIVGSVDTPGITLFVVAGGVAVAGDYVCLADGSSGFQVLPAQCNEPDLVELSSFQATPVGVAILLTWNTSLESNHLGFHVHRSLAADGDYARLTHEGIQPPGPYRFLDIGVSVGTTYFYRLEAVDRVGGSTFYGPIMARMESPGVSRNRLEMSHPNPFSGEHPSTAIHFELVQRIHATVRIFDVFGRQVRQVVDETLPAGPHETSWDGRNDRNEPVVSGVYFCRLDAGSFSETRPLVRIE